MRRIAFDRHGDVVEVDEVPLSTSSSTPIEVHRPDDDMRLPAGASCADCASFQRCAWLIGCDPASSLCDWSPSRFRPARPLPAAPALPLK